ncbi:MAG: hypothetical protein VX893_01305 [Candidatus Latescibacterota bacterium]|nr:hypothetical protein [Candidatus Latescibacterota bacterium]
MPRSKSASQKCRSSRLTGLAEDAEGIEQATEILYKPYRMEALLETVRRLLY